MIVADVLQEGGVPAALKALKAEPRRLRAVLNLATAYAMTEAREHAYEVGFGGRPHLISRHGEAGLRGSITFKVLTTGFVSVGLIGSNLIYAAIHEKGGTIRAKQGKYLKFRMPSGQWVQKTEVTIPARPYLGPAVKLAAKHLKGRNGHIARAIMETEPR